MKFKAILLIFSALLSTNVFAAGDGDEGDCPVTVYGGVDAVSSYIFRGAECAGASLQPSFGFDLSGLKVGFWGSTDTQWNVKEFDLCASYSIKGLTLGVTDYFGPYNRADGVKYGYMDNHIDEGMISYDFSELCGFGLSLAWYTNFAGDDDYSSYCNAAYNFSLSGVDCTASVGLTPYKGIYKDKFSFTDISLKASRSLAITPTFELPLFVQAIFSPVADNAFLVAGVSIVLP